MGDAELVEVVEVCETEDYRRAKDDGLVGSFGEE